MTPPGRTCWSLLSWRRKLAVVLAVASLSLSLANRQFHWPAHDGISARGYSGKVPNQRLADDGHHWVLPAAVPILRPSHPTRVLLWPRPALVIVEHPVTALYDRPPPAA